ncbi:YafY family protein [Marinicella sp. S1101]|nr:YafY family protein [Marinicella marina]MCX7552357.1 YafY family protein [Marinicella marina]MDJ1139232.1 YafY family protein [Marinicella marina]
MKITHYLRQRRQAVTAKQVAEAFDICQRTVYRDIQCLMDSGVPIRGEAGVGYTIDKKYYLPPITFDADELEAIGLGINMVRQWTDDRFAEKAASAFAKIEAVLPTALQGELKQITTYAVLNQPIRTWSVSFSELREHIRAKTKLEIEYVDQHNHETIRVINPLALFFFNPVWLLLGWCEKRQDFRNFRLDRIRSTAITEQKFVDEVGKNLSAYLVSVGVCHE